MMRSFPLVVFVSMLLLSCRAPMSDCKPAETLSLNVPKSFETTREAKEGNVVVIRSTVTEYTKVAITIPYDQISRTRRWVSHESPAALTLSPAIELATQWVSRERSDDGSLRISGVFLSSYGCESEEDYWYYGVRFSSFRLDGDLFESNGATVVVLMDGTVIGPEMVN